MMCWFLQFLILRFIIDCFVSVSFCRISLLKLLSLSPIQLSAMLSRKCLTPIALTHVAILHLEWGSRMLLDMQKVHQLTPWPCQFHKDLVPINSVAWRQCMLNVYQILNNHIHCCICLSPCDYRNNDNIISPPQMRPALTKCQVVWQGKYHYITVNVQQ